jgi:hypothetical protein
MSDRALARYQSALLRLFYHQHDIAADERMRRLAEQPAFAPFRDHVATFDTNLVELGASITRRWGRPRERRAGQKRKAR